MKVEVEYTIRKKATIECNDITCVMDALLETEWSTGNRLLERKPEITSKLVIDDEITSYSREDGCHHLKPEILAQTPPKRIESIQEWLALLKERTDSVMKDNPHFTSEKARFIARQDMPDCPKDGWGQ